MQSIEKTTRTAQDTAQEITNEMMHTKRYSLTFREKLYEKVS